MKKITSFAVIAIAAFALMTGCSGTTTKNYILATGGTSGTYYPFGGAIANVQRDAGGAGGLHGQDDVRADLLLQEHAVGTDLHLQARARISPVHRDLGAAVGDQARDDAAAIGAVGRLDDLNDLGHLRLDEVISFLLRQRLEVKEDLLQLVHLLVAEEQVGLDSQKSPVVVDQLGNASFGALVRLGKDLNLVELGGLQEGRMDEGSELEVALIVFLEVLIPVDQVVARALQHFLQGG